MNNLYFNFEITNEKQYTECHNFKYLPHNIFEIRIVWLHTLLFYIN